ncbi:hypothetical protein GCM10027347_44770 [Larkinella harenae]
MLLETIEEIDRFITRQNPDTRIQLNGIAESKFIASENKAGFVIPGEEDRVFCLETSDYEFQILHVIRGGTPNTTNQYGSTISQSFNVDCTLIILTTLSDKLGAGIMAINQARCAQLKSFNNDTLSVLKNDLKLSVNQDSTPHPGLFARSFNYSIMGVRQEEFSLNCTPFFNISV